MVEEDLQNSHSQICRVVRKGWQRLQDPPHHSVHEMHELVQHVSCICGSVRVEEASQDGLEQKTFQLVEQPQVALKPQIKLADAGCKCSNP